MFRGQENKLLVLKKENLVAQNELSDVNKTYINIGNGQKFELSIFKKLMAYLKKSKHEIVEDCIATSIQTGLAIRSSKLIVLFVLKYLV